MKSRIMKLSSIFIALAPLAGTVLPVAAHTVTAQSTQHHLATHLIEAGLIGLVIIILFTGLHLLFNKR